MDVKSMNRWLAMPRRWEVREDICNITRSRYLSLLGYAFHSTNWEVWDNHSYLVCIVVDESSYESILFDEIIER